MQSGWTAGSGTLRQEKKNEEDTWAQPKSATGGGKKKHTKLHTLKARQSPPGCERQDSTKGERTKEHIVGKKKSRGAGKRETAEKKVGGIHPRPGQKTKPDLRQKKDNDLYWEGGSQRGETG